MNTLTMTCPLCLNRRVGLLHERMNAHDGRRAYWLCHACGMVFLDPALR